MSPAVLRIRTPEGVTFTYALAGPVVRGLACTVDIFCAMTVASVIGQVAGVAGMIDPDFMQGLTVIAYFACSIGYGVASEWLWRGQTIGKRLLRLRVIDASGLRLQFSQVLMRNLLRFVDMQPLFFYLLGGIVSVLSARAQRLGDLAAGTVVIHQPPRREPALDQFLTGKFNSLREHPHLAARLRQRVSPELARVVLQALERRDAFEPAARVTLFAELAEYLKGLVAFPPEAVEAMPDEQYVRGVADVLFQAPGERRTVR